MAPSASMLFLSYHRLHSPAAEAPREEAAGAGAGRGGFRLISASGVFSLGAFARRREVPAARAEGKAARGLHAGEENAAAAELEAKFEEALRLSCWSS